MPVRAELRLLEDDEEVIFDIVADVHNGYCLCRRYPG